MILNRNDDRRGPVRIELFTSELRAKGNWRSIDDERSLADLLNGGDRRLGLAPALVRRLDGSNPEIHPEVGFEKRSILAVVTADVSARAARRPFDAGERSEVGAGVSVSVVLPPFLAWGELSLPAGVILPRQPEGALSHTAELARRSLPRFLTLRGATLLLRDAVLIQADALCLNRDAATSIRRVRDHRSAGQSLAERFRGVS